MDGTIDYLITILSDLMPNYKMTKSWYHNTNMYYINIDRKHKHWNSIPVTAILVTFSDNEFILHINEEAITHKFNYTELNDHQGMITKLKHCIMRMPYDSGMKP